MLAPEGAGLDEINCARVYTHDPAAGRDYVFVHSGHHIKPAAQPLFKITAKMLLEQQQLTLVVYGKAEQTDVIGLKFLDELTDHRLIDKLTVPPT